MSIAMHRVMRRGRGRVPAPMLAALLLMTSSCGFSKLDPNAAVHVTGTVVNADGHPAAGAEVLLFKEADIGELVVGVTFALGTLGVACLTPAAPSVCAAARRATTGADGGFTFDLRGSDTQGSVENASTFDLTAIVPASAGGGTRSAATLRFEIQRAQLDLPPLRMWSGTPTVTGSSSRVSVSWPALAYDSDPSYSIRWVDSATDHSVWTVSNASSGASLDPRTLEDRSGSVVVDAQTTVPGPDTDLRFIYSSAAIPFQGKGVPLSRGRPCFAYGGNGRALPLTPCHLTDGDLFDAAGLTTGGCDGCTAAVHTSAYVDLGTVVPVSLVVVRGGAGLLAVEGSSDAQSWTLWGNGSGSLVAVTPSGAAHARYVRVRSISGLDMSGVTEMSAWR